MSINYVGVEPFSNDSPKNYLSFSKVSNKQIKDYNINPNLKNQNKRVESFTGEIPNMDFLVGAANSNTNNQRMGNFNSDPLLSETRENKVDTLIKEKERIFDDSERRYNTNTDIISNTFDHMNSKDSLLKNQKKIVSSNSDKIQEMNNDILSLRRQLELSYNEYKKRSFVIFILKNIFVYLMLALLIGILMNKKLLGNAVGSLLLFVSTVVIVLVIMYNAYLNRNRDLSLFDKIKFYNNVSEDQLNDDTLSDTSSQCSDDSKKMNQ